MIATLQIARMAGEAVVTFRNRFNEPVTQVNVEDNILSITDAITFTLHEDALKAEIEDFGVEFLRGMSPDDFNGTMANIVADVFPDHDDDPAGQYGDLVDLAHEAYGKLRA